MIESFIGSMVCVTESSSAMWRLSSYSAVNRGQSARLWSHRLGLDPRLGAFRLIHIGKWSLPRGDLSAAQDICVKSVGVQIDRSILNR